MVTGGERLNAGAGGILSYFTRHRTAANLLLILMLVAGLLSFPNMRAQFFPDVVVDDLTVSVNWSGAGAEDVDEDQQIELGNRAQIHTDILAKFAAGIGFVVPGFGKNPVHF